MSIILERFSEPGEVENVDTKNDDPMIKNGWRRETPPAGEDGTIPSRSDTVSGDHE